MTEFNLYKALLTALGRIDNPFSFLTAGAQRIYWLYLVWALLIGFFVFVRSSPGTSSLRGFVRFAFPKAVYNSRSAWVDYGWFLFLRPVFALMTLPAVVVIGPAIATATRQALRGWLPGGQDLLEAGPLAISLFTLTSILAADFSGFLAHNLQHRVPLLWEFHKVHHSAQKLTPITVYRMHPLDDVLFLGLVGAALAATHGLFEYLTIGPTGLATVFGVNFFTCLFLLFGANLRHSHIWIDYGPRVSPWLISPAQHQIHHSSAPRHRDRNMGQIFACWDRLFGTLYVPDGREEFSYGIDGREEIEFSDPLRLFWLPFRKLFQWPGLSGAAVGTAMVASVLGLGVATAAVIAPEENPDAAQVRVQMEEMTWLEVDRRVAAGARTVLIPTAGHEQNGPHLVLGKHHHVVRHAAERIARELGDTLVAPVVTYVPEGAIDPPEQHMEFAGTISMPPAIFEAILENAARSLRVHGFQLICFVGDSGGNQEGQARVAEKLNAEWRDEQTRVIQVDHYYSENHQLSWLEAQGIPAAEVGTHAGIRDTSEMLYVYPEGVRKQRLSQGMHNRSVGVIGDPTRASAEIGRKMIDLKVAAAVAQIRPAREQALGPSR